MTDPSFPDDAVYGVRDATAHVDPQGHIAAVFSIGDRRVHVRLPEAAVRRLSAALTAIVRDLAPAPSPVQALPIDELAARRQRVQASAQPIDGGHAA